MEPFSFPTIIDEEDTAFYADANCAGTNTESFFVESGNNYPPEVRRICGNCIVISQCLTFALKYNVQGYWAGTHEKQRKAMKRGRL